MSTTSSQQQDEDYQFSNNQSDDDAYSTGGDSGFSMGQDDATEKQEKVKKIEQKKQDDPVATTTENDTPSASSLNFFSRVASIPVIQDSFIGAQNIVRQHAVGQKALDYAKTKLQNIVVSAKPYLPNEENNAGRILSKANNLGNRSLDLLEKQFPSISSPTNQLVQPVTGRIGTSVSHLLEKKAVMVDPRIDYIANGFESLIDQYLPEEEENQPTTKNMNLHGIDRLMYTVNVLSTRASKKISKKASATMDEEKQIKQMIRAWVLEQTNNMVQQPMLQDSMESFKKKFLYENSPIQVMYSFTQTEFDKVRQELCKPNISHLDRIRNILVLSQTDILVPLYQRSRSMIRQQEKLNKEEPVVVAAS